MRERFTHTQTHTDRHTQTRTRAHTCIHAGRRVVQQRGTAEVDATNACRQRTEVI